MRVAIVHDPRSDLTAQGLIVESLQRIVPTAQVVHCDVAADLQMDAASNRSPARHRLAHAQIAQADFVISTSRAAANLVPLLPGRLHVCYLTSLTRSESLHQSRMRTTPLVEFPRMMAAVGLSPLNENRFSHPPTDLPRRSITHFLAGSGSVARSIRSETGCPVKVIPPPVAIEQFRPSKQRRSDYYVATADRYDTSALNLAIEACRLAERKLVVLADAPLQIPHSSHLPEHVQYIVATSGEEKHRQLCGCRALLCSQDADFDPLVVAAQACGTPVIVPANSGVAETVTDAEGDGQGTGLYFEGLFPENLASAIRELEQRPQKISAALAWANAMKYSSQRFERSFTEFLEAVRVASSFVTQKTPLPPPGDLNRPAA